MRRSGYIIEECLNENDESSTTTVKENDSENFNED
jgi:hypothetical protein